MYQWVVFAHVFAVFGFLIGHGASAAVIFRLRRERDVNSIRVLLDLSRRANGVANACLLVLIAAGVTAGFMGGWWGRTGSGPRLACWSSSASRCSPLARDPSFGFACWWT